MFKQVYSESERTILKKPTEGDIVRNFLGLDEQESRLDKSRYVILPVPYEFTTTYGHGTVLGPAAIVEASQEVELFDDELKTEPYRAGIHTAELVEVIRESPHKQNQVVYRRYVELVQRGKVVCMLGGEHSITYGTVKACLEKFPKLTVLQIDAHADLRDSYLGDPHNHACVMRRVRDLTDKTVSVGIRNYSTEEHHYIQEHHVRIFSAYEMSRSSDWIEKVAECLNGDIYITFDLDAFDPSLVPAVGTPEPGGLSWYDAVGLLRQVISKCNLVGFDVMELSPIEGEIASNFTAAKLVYKIIAYHDFVQNKG